MRIRAARTLVFSRQDDGLLAFNFLSGSEFGCSPDLLTLLGMLDDWAEFDDIAAALPAMTRDELAASIDDLIAVNAVIPEGAALGEAEETYRDRWGWGIPAALFHFSVQDKHYMSLEQAEDLQRAKLAQCGQPALHMTNKRQCGTVLPLPPALDHNALLQFMARRRTVREAAPEPLALKQLSDCLFAGMGIVGKTTNCAGALPLSMTPSGGARNPYEAYVYARAVEGLEPGFYHYSAYEHTLGRLDATELPPPSALMGGQDWADEMPCVVVLCAYFERTMWKYSDDNAYRVVLIEAGHIGQNLMLAATQHGLSACPSAALSHSAIREWLGLGDRFTCAPVYALTLAHCPGGAGVESFPWPAVDHPGPNGLLPENSPGRTEGRGSFA
jgi:SagB-type dehydrogenase family enzyme